jgi:hypothetical protein
MQRRPPDPNRRPAPQSTRRFTPPVKPTQAFRGRGPVAKPAPRRARGQR